MAKTAVMVDQPNSGLQQLKTGPARLGEFLKDVRSEMKKVVTPSRAEVQATTIVVIVTVFVFAAYFGAVDFLVGHLMDFIFKHLAK
jgi:preprotein translocase subunit SecE